MGGIYCATYTFIAFQLVLLENRASLKKYDAAQNYDLLENLSWGIWSDFKNKFRMGLVVGFTVYKVIMYFPGIFLKAGVCVIW